MFAVHPEALPPPPPPAPPKGKKAEPLPPAVPLDPTAFHWTGDRHVYLVQLNISPDSIKSRYRCDFSCKTWLEQQSSLEVIRKLQFRLRSCLPCAKGQISAGVRCTCTLKIVWLWCRTAWKVQHNVKYMLHLLRRAMTTRQILCWTCVLLHVPMWCSTPWTQMLTRTNIWMSCSLSYRAGIAQAAADEAAMMAPPSPPPEPAANTPTPSRSRRTAAPAPKPVGPTPKKAAVGVSARRKSKSDAGGQKLVLPDADSSLQPPAEPAVTDTPAPEAIDDTPAELSAAIAAWQQFDEQAKNWVVGRAQSDNMVQLLSSQVEGKQPDQVVMEVDFSHLPPEFGSRDTDYVYSLCWFSHRPHSFKAAQTVSLLSHGLEWTGRADGHMHCVCASQAPNTTNLQPALASHFSLVLLRCVV